MYIIILIIFLSALLFTATRLRKKKPVTVTPIPVAYKLLLAEEVPFYQQLDENKKIEFEERVQHFLAQVKITGVKTTVEDIDRVLVAASAVIPIFNFTDWEYVNLHEVLLYPDSFDHDFEQQGDDRNILGMVGSGAMNHMMILSQFELRQAFSNKTGKNNTAIHEFVHLVDKTDGTIDGVPESMLDKKYIVPWLQLMQKEIELIHDDRSDINPYGSTNQAEFFAVVSEYFFERPALLQEKHPELYELLLKIFKLPAAVPDNK
ncbi:MAG TPA: M90 family metallopeptidase [Ferruginibacter sp.]|nr:M90 family metallopeptidase [Ferruginibacter sp.]